MEDDKYYTPIIEDFYIGFEYEWRYKPESMIGMMSNPNFVTEADLRYRDNLFHERITWKKTVLDKEMVSWDPDGGALENPLDPHSDIEFRVKYLDLDDIEANGFKYDSKAEEFISNKTYLGIGTGDDSKIRICHDEDDNYVQIYYKSNRGDESIKFEGFINNASEFKKILKMIRL